MFAVVSGRVVLGHSGCPPRTVDDVEREFIEGLRRLVEVLDYHLEPYFDAGWDAGALCGGWSRHYFFAVIVRLRERRDVYVAIGYVSEHKLSEDERVKFKVFDTLDEARRYFEQLVDP